MFGLEWLAITAVTVIIIGKVVAGLHFSDAASQLVYMQKLFFVVAVSLFSQVLWGHRLPLITGPATVLLVGIVAGGGSDIHAVYTTIAAGGAFLVVLSITGLFSMITRFFTFRVVATILMLIALTITPTILALILDAPSPDKALTKPGVRPGLFADDACGRIDCSRGFGNQPCLSGQSLPEASCSWQSPLRMDGGIAANWGIFSSFFADFTTQLIWDPGLLVSFLVCFIALSINDLGSIHAVGRLINPPAMKRRVTAGITFTGLSNILAGLFWRHRPGELFHECGNHRRQRQCFPPHPDPRKPRLAGDRFFARGGRLYLECTRRSGGERSCFTL